MTTALALLNGALLAVVIWQAFLLHKRRDEAEPVASEANPAANAPSSSSSSAETSSGALAIDDNPESNPIRSAHGAAPSQSAKGDTDPKRPHFGWEQVESEDYRTYIGNLRSIGCPEQTVQDIIVADVMEAFAARRAEAMADGLRDVHYWQSDTAAVAARSDLEHHQREIDEWTGSVLHELIGPDVALPSTKSAWRQAKLAEQLNFLPAQTRGEVLDVLSQYADVDTKTRAISSNRHDLAPENPDERLRVLADYESKREALLTLLTPKEYELVDMTTSWTADNLRRAMTKFEPTEEEFRIIFREWRAHDENLAVLYATGVPDPGNAHIFEAISHALTPERYALYRETWWK